MASTITVTLSELIPENLTNGTYALNHQETTLEAGSDVDFLVYGPGENEDPQDYTAYLVNWRKTDWTAGNLNSNPFENDVASVTGKTGSPSLIGAIKKFADLRQTGSGEYTIVVVIGDHIWLEDPKMQINP